MILATALLKSRKYAWAPILSVLLLCPVGIISLRKFGMKGIRAAQFYMASTQILVSMGLIVLLLWLGVQIGAEGELYNHETKAMLIADAKDIYNSSFVARIISAGEALNYDGLCDSARMNLDGFSVQDRENIALACDDATTCWFLV